MTITNCKACGCPLCPSNTTPPPGYRRHMGRGLCNLCRKRHSDTLDQFPRAERVTTRRPASCSLEAPPEIVADCAVCDVPMASAAYRAVPGAWWVRHKGRGLCADCYRVHELAGTLSDFPSSLRPVRETYRRWLELEAQGVSLRDAAARLGITAKRLGRIRSQGNRGEL